MEVCADQFIKGCLGLIAFSWRIDSVKILLRVFAAVTSLVATGLVADCKDTRPTPGLTRFYSDTWGIDNGNTRFQPPEKTSISAANVSRLQLKWVYRYATDKPRSYPLVTEDTIFIGDSNNGVIALDRETGCTRWTSAWKGEIASAILHERSNGSVRLFFTDRVDGVVAIDASTGKLLWRSKPGDNPVPMFSGTPLVYSGSIYVTISSTEIGLALNPFYGCCTTSGGLAALDTSTGAVKWTLRTIDQKPQVTGRHFYFVEEHGPSGAPAWAAPALDEKRGLLFFGTGQNYSHPVTATSDAVFAVRVRDGSRQWVHQFTEGDAYNIACDISARHVNCPDPLGPDLDFGAPPMLSTLPDGRDVLITGQKSGVVYAMNPDDGNLYWKQRVGRGGALGGVHWGLAVNQSLGLVFVPISDIDAGKLTGVGSANPGVHALDLATGSNRWSHRRASRCAERNCWGGISAAIISTADLVFSGGLDGQLEALDARTGKLIWSHDSLHEYPAINGKEASGGAYDAHGPMLVDDLLIVSSGYNSYFQRAGDALLVFQLQGEKTP